MRDRLSTDSRRPVRRQGLGHTYLLLALLLGPLQLPHLPVELMPLFLVGCNLLLLLGFLLLGLGQLCLQGGHVLHLHAMLWGKEGGLAKSWAGWGSPPRASAAQERARALCSTLLLWHCGLRSGWLHLGAVLSLPSPVAAALPGAFCWSSLLAAGLGWSPWLR